MELWGGVECTMARIGSDYRNQLQDTGHWSRVHDLDLIASLGIQTLRYPILWEAHVPSEKARPDFRWSDERLSALRERGIEVIAGLLHHGSGPAWTNLLDPDFPVRFADYAGQVATRYPWIKRWTPINEPLTTARFSCLYGHWYPHRRDYRSFLTAVVNQCRAIAAAMAAIRSVIPEAELVQTEDLGRTFATAPLRYQANHDNARRWLSLDLLFGEVGPRHPMWAHLTDAGIEPAVMEAMQASPTPPDLIGINHYLTSDRFLDHRVHLYPGEQAGGNGRELFVDAEAVRIRHLAGRTGLAARLREAWRRYRRPLAVTEVHHGCTRDEQLRWLAQCWATGRELCGEGIDLRAITLWSLFGQYDWRSLLTRREGAYDAGAFDVRADPPRATAVATAARALARNGFIDHPVARQPGWWQRADRCYAWQGRGQGTESPGRPILITGASGTLGQALARICETRGLPFRLTARSELDICSRSSIKAAIARHRPWAVINAAGFVRVADADRERASCFAWNADGPERLAQACEAAEIPLVTFSSDLVFDGQSGGGYVESDPVNPLCVYGESKAEAERRVLRESGRALVIRTAAFFGEWDRHNFAHQALSAVERGQTWRACPSAEVSPTYVPDLCHAALDLLIDGERGIWHLANQGRISWFAFARSLVETAGHPPALVEAYAAADRTCTALGSERGSIMRPLDEAVKAFVAARTSWVAEPAAVAAE